MELGRFDIAIAAAFFAAVIGLSLWKGARRGDSADYFLAGRTLPWWLIGISIVAANISTEQFVGMAGQGAGSVGLAVIHMAIDGRVHDRADRVHAAAALPPGGHLHDAGVSGIVIQRRNALADGGADGGDLCGRLADRGALFRGIDATDHL